MKKPKKPTIGPATKKQAKKAAPKVPMTPAKTAEMKKAKRKDTMATIGAGVAAIGGSIISAVRTNRREKGAAKWREQNPTKGDGSIPSNKELRKMGRGGLKKTK